MSRSTHWGILTLTLILIGTSGCFQGSSGPAAPKGPTGVVKGKVTFNGQPVTKGNIMLDNNAGSILGGPIKSDGSFELSGAHGRAVPVGTYRVGITPPPNPPPAPGAATMPPPPSIEGIPPKFYNSATSGATVEIKAGEQELTIDLKG